ncbi:hypothetical protein COOONC_25396 [Cooperia oncophora]
MRQPLWHNLPFTKRNLQILKALERHCGLGNDTLMGGIEPGTVDCSVSKPKSRFISQVNCQTLTTNVDDIDQAIKDLKMVSANFRKKGVGKLVLIDKPLQEMEPEEESHDATKTLSTPPTTPPPTTFTTTLLMPPSTCPAGTARKLTPMPRDLHPPHHTKPIRYALFEPVNWIYDSCLTDKEFDEKVCFYSLRKNFFASIDWKS